MGVNKSIERMIQEFSVEKGFFEGDPQQERLIRKIAKSLGKGCVMDSKELWGEEASEYAIFYQYTKDVDFPKLLEELMTHVPEENEYQMYHIVIFTDTLFHKAEVRKWEGEIRDSIKKKLKCGLSSIGYQILTYWNNEKKVFSIDIGNRINRIEMLEKEGEACLKAEGMIAKKVKAYIYTASLFDIVKIYNEMGDELFRKNVRYGINDQLDVEESIKETLRTCPENFWYLNNGITILVQDRFALNLGKTSSIGLDCGKSQVISVINGAQTISTAARFWYEDTGNKDPQTDDSTLREHAKTAAKVLLRVMCITDSANNCKKELDEISISLNRQKPIKSEDIAYTSPVVMEINQLYHPEDGDDIHFRITKRGEEVLGRYKYSLTDFARVVTAYRMQKPGEARTKAANSLLKYIPNEAESIYADEILEGDTEAVFEKYYKPTNFAMSLLNYYKEYGKRSDQTEHKYAPAILGNGRYYFTAYMVHVLHENKDDFTDWNYSPEKIKEGFDLCTEKYVRVLGQIGEEYLQESEEETIESNTFKREALYKTLIGYEESGKDEEVKKAVHELKEEIRGWFAGN